MIFVLFVEIELELEDGEYEERNIMDSGYDEFLMILGSGIWFNYFFNFDFFWMYSLESDVLGILDIGLIGVWCRSKCCVWNYWLFF